MSDVDSVAAAASAPMTEAPKAPPTEANKPVSAVPAAEPAPVVEAAEPVVEAAEPVVEAAEPAPVTEAAEPAPIGEAADPAPVVEAAESALVVQAAEAMVEAVASTPVAEAAKSTPVMEAAAPEPVVEAAAPEPVVEAAAPAPVTDAAEPEPVVEAAEPAPVVESAQPATESTAESHAEVSAEASHAVPFTLALVSGGCAGTTVDIALYPLDTIKVRLQASEGFWKAGGLRGLYNGVTATALGAAPGSAFFFSAYESMKPRLQALNGGREHWVQHSVAASVGEMAACLIRVPTGVVTQRMQVGQFTSYIDGIKGILASESGAMNFFTGFWTTVAREIPFSFIQFPLYEGFKKFWAKSQGAETTPMQGAACGSISGAIAGGLTTPLDVIKTRMMLGATSASGEKYVGTVKSLRTVAQEEGMLTLYRGIGPRVGWISIGGFIFFGAYEKSMDMLYKTGIWKKP